MRDIHICISVQTTMLPSSSKLMLTMEASPKLMMANQASIMMMVSMAVRWLMPKARNLW